MVVENTMITVGIKDNKTKIQIATSPVSARYTGDDSKCTLVLELQRAAGETKLVLESYSLIII